VASKSDDSKPSVACRRRRLFFVGLLVLSLALFMFSGNHSSLSPLESRLFGEWSSHPHEYTRIFSPDRTFSTSDEQFFGEWQINEGRLTLTYWPSTQISPSYDIRSTFNQMRIALQTDTCTWDIEFTEDNQQHVLNHPVDEYHPDGKWLFSRVPDR